MSDAHSTPAVERILAKLNDRQREAVTAPAGPLLILAGAGSGKTSVLTRRVAYRIETGTAPERILAVTFTNKAAGEMRRRIEKLLDPDRARKLTMGTFHSVCFRFLRMEHEAAGLHKNFTILDEDDQKALAKTLCTDTLEPAKSRLNDLLGRISLAKNKLIDRFDYASAASDREEEMASALWLRYEEACAKQRVIDFDDLLVLPVRTLERDARVRERWQARFDAVHIDEFQDTNVVQARLTDLLAARTRDLTVVGDDAQSIYSWRGAEIRNILDFEKTYPGATVVKLEENYRSTQPVLDAANALLTLARGVRPKTLFTQKQSGNKPMLVHCEDAEEEARFVSGKIRELVDFGTPLSQIAVLYRTGAQSQPFEEMCLKTGTKYRIVGGTRFFERREVKDVLAYLHLLLNPDSEIAFGRAINTPARGLGDKARTTIIAAAAAQKVSLVEACRTAVLPPKQRLAAAGFAETLAALEAVGIKKGLAALVRETATRSGILKALEAETDGKERMANVQQIANVAADIEQQEETPWPTSLEMFLAHAALMSSLDEAREGEEALTLMTLHAAKGLEFDAVFLAGCDEGLLPHRSTYGDPAANEEERRLAYVGVTRAKRSLFLLTASRRQIWGSWEDTSPSRYVREMQEAGVLAETTVRGQSARKSPRWRDDVPFRPRAATRQPTPLMRTPTKPQRAYKAGQVVQHTHFGTGKITAVAPFGEGGDQLLTVQFADREKKLLASVAPLKVISAA